MFACTNDGNSRAASRRQEEPKSVRKKGDATGGKSAGDKGREGDKGQIFGGDDKVQVKNHREDALMCCLQKRELEAPV